MNDYFIPEGRFDGSPGDFIHDTPGFDTFSQARQLAFGDCRRSPGEVYRTPESTCMGLDRQNPFQMISGLLRSQLNPYYQADSSYPGYASGSDFYSGFQNGRVPCMAGGDQSFASLLRGNCSGRGLAGRGQIATLATRIIGHCLARAFRHRW
ncbi:MAG: hypothetical protein AB7W16_13410 [Candidatus Obscuribacterales bacterium]